MSEPSRAPPKFVSDLAGWYSMTMLALGSRTGLLDTISEGSGTAEEIGARAGVDPRNCLEWLRALTAAGHVTAADGQFALSAETTMVLGPEFPVHARAIIDFASGTPAVMDEVAKAMHTGQGVGPGTYHRSYGEAVATINTPIYAAALVPEWIGGVAGLVETLTTGGQVADIACGNGAAAALIGTAFPRTHVIGYDLDPAVLSRGDCPAMSNSAWRTRGRCRTATGSTS